VATLHKLSRVKEPYYGASKQALKFLELVTMENMKATWALSPTEKLVAKGTLALDLHSNSYTFKDEVVITLWSSKYPDLNNPERRALNKGFFRVEIPIPVSSETRDLFLSVAQLIDAKLQGVV